MALIRCRIQLLLQKSAIIFDRAFSSVMAGEISPEDGCKQAAEEMRAAVKANPD